MEAQLSSTEVRVSQRAAAQIEIHDLLAWMWDTITEPVLTVLNHTAAC